MIVNCRKDVCSTSQNPSLHLPLPPQAKNSCPSYKCPRLHLQLLSFHEGTPFPRCAHADEQARSISAELKSEQAELEWKALPAPQLHASGSEVLPLYDESAF